MDTVACDIGSFQPLGKLMGEKHIAQFAVAVRMEKLPAVSASSQVFVCNQSLKIQKQPC